MVYTPTFYGLLRAFASAKRTYNNNVTNAKTAIAIAATVDLFSFGFDTGQYKCILVEVSASGIMQGVGSRIITAYYHLAWSNTTGVWTSLATPWFNGTAGNQLTLTATDGAIPKLSVVTVGSAGGSDIKVNIRVVGDDYTVLAL